MISYDALRTILTMSITGSVIAVILFALKPLIRNRMPKTTQYYLWLVVLAALVVPISRLVILPDTVPYIPTISKTVDWYVADNGVIHDRVTPYQRIDENGFIGIPESSMAEVEAIVPDPWIPEAIDWFRLIHSLGVIGYFAFVACSYAAFTSRMKRRNTEATANEKDILAELCGNRRPPHLCRNQLAATPMLIGLFRPEIILPDKEYSDTQLRSVLLHELTHLRRKDVLVKWLTVIVTAIHWFNPIVWFVRREIDRACEMACDETVIRNLDTDGKQNYGETLIYVAADSKTPHAVLSTTMCEEKKALKERLGAIMKSKKHTRLAIILSAVLILAVGGTAIALGAGWAAIPDEPPNITIRTEGAYENTAIDWVAGKNKWNNAVYDREDTFVELMNRYRSVSNLPYVRNGENITITFDGAIPNNVTLTEYILREDGREKYNSSGKEYEIRFSGMNRRSSFVVEPNFATALSSNSNDYLPGNTIKGYRLVASWGANECEYGFIIRGDAAMTFTFESPAATFSPRKWVDYEVNDNSFWAASYDLMLDEFPDVLFTWTANGITATHDNSTNELFMGMPVWNVYLADLNGDGLPEFCGTVSLGSGIVDTRIVVHDYANERTYDLSDRMLYDYHLSLENGQLLVKQYDYMNIDGIGEPRGIGSMAIIDGELVVFGIDRIFANADPLPTTPPYEIGKVSAITNGREYEPDEHFLYSMQLTENGLLSADGVPMPFEEFFASLSEIYYAEDFQVVISGSDISTINYTLYDDRFNSVYSREREFLPPVENGVYLLCVDVTWSNDGTQEYIGLRYVFKIRV